MTLHESGEISRPKIGMKSSGQWLVTGAVTRDNFGHVVRRYSLEEVFNNPRSIPWKFKNGKQQTFVTDLDHGTAREWCSPVHRIF